MIHTSHPLTTADGDKKLGDRQASNCSRTGFGVEWMAVPHFCSSGDTCLSLPDALSPSSTAFLHSSNRSRTQPCLSGYSVISCVMTRCYKALKKTDFCYNKPSNFTSSNCERQDSLSLKVLLSVDSVTAGGPSISTKPGLQMFL